ncbi:FadR/GntR family transcriptional regulator [Oceanidesulfovibrio marinus]|uniref:FadR family transcriptional regulator n=1 Tax=Oceanidesulfovibrio marinus TaxID=370038 RepID=A0A6P1ZIC5_9BACT|nr:FCD domain-containing protein [Oceanidesulfovibrio marinus]TVM35053.1 FadR family transcriptional regulator [Oceanidesulfovibrio marinus]
MTSLTIPPVSATHSVSAEVARRIRVMLASGELAPGDRLPAERRLAEAFGVSRNSVREAIRVLTNQGLIISKVGSGTYVADVQGEEFAAALAGVVALERKRLSDIFQVRLFLEPQIAALAAQNRTEEELAELETLLESQRQAIAATGDGHAEDQAFHARLAAMTDNAVVERLAATISDIVGESRAEGLQSRERQSASVLAHEHILKALHEGDAEAAEKAMRDHLESIRGMLFPEE